MKPEDMLKPEGNAGPRIVLEKQVDGNWKGWMYKNGKLIEERQVDPTYVLQALLTNNGK